jgi:energy-coupling factor transport system substrate-specific component
MKIQEEFTTFTVALIPVAMAMNIAVGQLVALLKLPVYLDCIDTVLVGLACGVG